MKRIYTADKEYYWFTQDGKGGTYKAAHGLSIDDTAHSFHFDPSTLELTYTDTSGEQTITLNQTEIDNAELI